MIGHPLRHCRGGSGGGGEGGRDHKSLAYAMISVAIHVLGETSVTRATVGRRPPMSAIQNFPLRFGIQLRPQATTVDELRRVWRVVDNMGADEINGTA